MLDIRQNSRKKTLVRIIRALVITSMILGILYVCGFGAYRWYDDNYGTGTAPTATYKTIAPTPSIDSAAN